MADTEADFDGAKTEADALTGRILVLRDAYYERDTVLVSDDEYDTLLRRLQEIERLFLARREQRKAPGRTVAA